MKLITRFAATLFATAVLAGFNLASAQDTKAGAPNLEKVTPLLTGFYVGKIELFDKNDKEKVVVSAVVRVWVDRANEKRSEGKVQVFRRDQTCTNQFPWQGVPVTEGDFWDVDSDKDVTKGCARTLTLKQDGDKRLTGTLMGKEAKRTFYLTAERN